MEELLEVPFHGNDPLAEQAVDSLGLEQLADFIDQVYGVRLDDGDMVEENFESLSVLADLVLSRC